MLQNSEKCKNFLEMLKPLADFHKRVSSGAKILRIIKKPKS